MKNNFVSYSHVSLGKQVSIGEYCVIGWPKEQSIKHQHHLKEDILIERELTPVKISDDCIIGNHVCIYEGVEIGAETVIEDYVRLGYESKIGRNVRIMHGAYICDRVSIGDNARISGLVCDGTQIGDRTTVMGDVIHEYTKPHLGWWETDEAPPIIESDVVIGWGAKVIGGIRICSYTYIESGAIVTKSVPTRHIVKGINEQIPLKDWKGNRLKDLIRYWSHEK